jgi:hypothetical protein
LGTGDVPTLILGFGVVHGHRLALGEQRDLVVVHPHGMCHRPTPAEDSEILHVADNRLAVVLYADVALDLGLLKVGVDTKVIFLGNFVGRDQKVVRTAGWVGGRGKDGDQPFVAMPPGDGLFAHGGNLVDRRGQERVVARQRRQQFVVVADDLRGIQVVIRAVPYA